MIPNLVASSDDTPHPYPQSFSGSSVIHGVRQLSFSHSETIDPRLLVNRSSELPSQDNVPNLSLSTSEGGGYYENPSPVPSTSTPIEIWMGYPFPTDEFPPSMPSPISPLLDEMGATYAILMDSCICGCGGPPCIPQREYDRQRTDPLNENDLQEMILFSVDGRCGYSLGDALRKAYTGLDGRDDKLFGGFKSSISIRVEWLPYEKWTRQIRTLTWKKPPENITRAKLATEVAKRMSIFFDEMQDKEADLSYYEYRIQPGVIDLDHVELVALKRVSKASYMPHFRVITSPQQQ